MVKNMLTCPNFHFVRVLLKILNPPSSINRPRGVGSRVFVDLCNTVKISLSQLAKLTVLPIPAEIYADNDRSILQFTQTFVI